MYLGACRLLVVGGGSAGLGMASKMARKLPKGSITLIDSIQVTYFDLVYLHPIGNHK